MSRASYIRGLEITQWSRDEDMTSAPKLTSTVQNIRSSHKLSINTIFLYNAELILARRL